MQAKNVISRASLIPDKRVTYRTGKASLNLLSFETPKEELFILHFSRYSKKENRQACVDLFFLDLTAIDRLRRKPSSHV
jgi:hypothetical protein